MRNGRVDEDCPTQQLMAFMGEKWVPGLVHLLSQGTQRPSPTLRRQPPICSPPRLVPKIFVLTASPIFVASQRSGCLPAVIPGPSFHGW